MICASNRLWPPRPTATVRVSSGLVRRVISAVQPLRPAKNAPMSLVRKTVRSNSARKAASRPIHRARKSLARQNPAPMSPGPKPRALMRAGLASGHRASSRRATKLLPPSPLRRVRPRMLRPSLGHRSIAPAKPTRPAHLSLTRNPISIRRPPLRVRPPSPRSLSLPKRASRTASEDRSRGRAANGGAPLFL